MRKLLAGALRVKGVSEMIFQMKSIAWQCVLPIACCLVFGYCARLEWSMK
jgi:hypothetical protein